MVQAKMGEHVLSLRLASLHEFLRRTLPPAPARLLEIGCGSGALALALAGDGYAVTAIDPKAPDGSIFRRVTLEEFEPDGRFDAVLASVALHHVEDLDAGVAKVAGLLEPGAPLVLEEFARERLAGQTACWYFHQRRAMEAAGLDDAPVGDDFDSWLEGWHESHADVHPAADLRRALAAPFEERLFTWTPYLYDYRLSDALEPLERELIDSGAIDPVGWRYLGVPRP
jgi:SAM-dependent methyltransferase